jgi:predicted ATPase
MEDAAPVAVETITNLTIKGFKSIKNLDDLKLARFNVLIGANGSGKSNFIDFFLMLNDMFGSTNGDFQRFAFQKGQASSLLYYGPDETQSMDASIQFDGDGQWSRYSFSLGWGEPDNLHFTDELLEYQTDGNDTEPRQKHFNSPHLESSVLKQSDSQSDLAVSTVARVFRNRLRQVRVYHFHDTSEKAGIRRTQDLHREDYLMTNAGNLAVFLHNLKNNKPAHYRRVLAAIQLVAPFISDFVVEPEVTDSRFVLLRWKDRSGETFGPHQLSDGTLRALALITALLQPEETMPSIMFFDEPELGLHPAAIGLVAGLLKAASLKRQVVVATQSPILIREYAPEDIIVVERREDDNGHGASHFTRLDNEALGNWVNRFDLGKLYEMNVTGGGAQ